MKYNVTFSKRIFPQPTISAPYGVRSAGRYRLWEKFHQSVRENLDFLELFWVVSGSFIIRQQNDTLTLYPREACFLFPGDNHEYWTNEKTDICWLTIDGRHCSRFADDYQLSRGSFPAGRCPVEKFAQLEMEVDEFSSIGEYTALSTALTIIHMALSGACAREEMPHLVARFKKLAEQHFRDRDCGVDTIAEKLHVHRATLHRIFSEYSGISPSEFIAKLRLQEAMRLLNNGCPIIRAAELSGYANANYMSKVIRRKTGYSPSECRNIALPVQPKFS